MRRDRGLPGSRRRAYTLPRGDARAAEPDVPFLARGAYTGDDRATRLAGVALVWNVFRHFYPYFDVVDVDWMAELPRVLSSAATDADGLAFLATLRRLVAALDDGHGGVIHPAVRPSHQPPILWAWIEDRLVITATGRGATGVRPGDVVLRINGRPVAEVLAEQEALTGAATPQYRRYAALQWLLYGRAGSKLELELEGSGTGPRNVVLRRTLIAGSLDEPRPEPVAELRPGIMYVDLRRFDGEAFRAALPRLAAANGLIFDLRGYPRADVTPVLQHLTTTPITSAHRHPADDPRVPHHRGRGRGAGRGARARDRVPRGTVSGRERGAGRQRGTPPPSGRHRPEPPLPS